MKEFAMLVLIGFGMGIFFALGSFTWEWFAKRFLGWRQPKEGTQRLIVEVDNRQAMAALDELTQKLERVKASAAGTLP